MKMVTESHDVFFSRRVELENQRKLDEERRRKQEEVDRKAAVRLINILYAIYFY